MKPWLKRIAVVLAVLLVLALLTPLIIIAALQSDQVRALAVDRALTDINEEIPGTIGVERVDGSLLGDARVRDVQITDARGNLAAQIERVDLNFRLLPLLRGNVVVNEVTAQGATATVRTYDDEVLNWELVVEPDPEPVVDPFDWPVYVDAVELTDAAVAYFDETVDIDDAPPELDTWRGERIAEMDDATTAHELREAFNAGFAPEQLAAIAEPRAPVAMWATDVTTTAELAMQGHNIEASVDELLAELQADILPEPVDASVAHIDAILSTSTVAVSIDSVDVDRWLQGGDLSANVLLPTLQRQIDAWEAGDIIEPGFERVAVDLGWWTIDEAALLWAAPDVELTHPLHLAGDVALDDEILVLDAEVDHDDAAQPITASAELTDYDADEPGYDAVVEAPQFDLHQWIVDPEIPAVETSALARIEGRGFDPDDLQAEVRVRLDDTLIDETYAADMLYAAASIEDGVIDGYNIGALTPYLDLIGAARLDLDGRATARMFTTAHLHDDRRIDDERAALRAERADSELELDLHFDPDIDDVDFEDPDEIAGLLRSMQVDADWDIAGLDIEDIQLASSDGELDLTVDRTDAAATEFRSDYRIDATASGFRFEDYAASSFQLSDRGSATARLPVDEPLAALRDFENDARLSAAGVRSPEGDVDSARIAASVQRDQAQPDRVIANVDADVQGLRSPQLNAASLQADYDGELFSDDGELLVDRARGDATFAADGLSGPDFDVESADGQLSADARLTTGDMPLRSVQADLNARTGRVSTPDVAAQSSRMRFNGTIQMPRPGATAADSDGQIEFRTSQVETPDVTLRSVDAGFDGQFRLVDADIPLDHFDGRITADVDQISADEATVAGAEADFDADVTLTGSDDPMEMIERFAIAGDASASDIDSEPFDASTDSVALNIDMQGTVDDPTGDLGVTATRIRYEDERVDSAAATVTMLEELRKGRFTLDVQRRADQQLAAAADFEFEPDYEAGEVQALTLETDRASWRSTPESTLRWTGTRAEADEFLFSSDDDQSLFVDGHVHPDVDQQLQAMVDLDIESILHGLYLDEFVPDLPHLVGSLEAEARVGGTATAPTGELDAWLDELHVDGVGPFGAVVDADYDDERFELRNLEASAFGEPAADASASIPVALDLAEGDVEFFVRRHTDIWTRIHPRQLREFHAVAPELNAYGVDGLVDLEFEFSGTIERPFVDLDAEVDDFRMQGEIGDDFIDLRNLDAVAELLYEPAVDDGDGLDFRAHVDWEDETVAQLGAITPFPFEEWLVTFVDDMEEPDLWREELRELPFQAYAQVPSFDLELVPLEDLRDDNLTGEATFDLAAFGTLADPRGDIRLFVDEAGWSYYRDFAFQLDASIQDEMAVFDHMHLTWGDDDVFTGAGEVPLPITTLLAGEQISDLPIDFQWRLHDVELSRLSAIDYTLARVDGYAGADIELGGSVRAPEFDISAGVYDTQLGDRGHGSAQVSLAGADNRVGVGGHITREDKELLAFQGDFPIDLDVIGWEGDDPWQDEGELEFALQTEPLDLEQLVPAYLFTDMLQDPEGILQLEARLNGTWERLEGAGMLQLDDGALTIPELGRGFEDITAYMELDDEQLSIDQLEVHDGPSSVTASGHVEHQWLVPGELHADVNADQFNLVGMGVDFPMFVTADAEAGGELLGDPGEMDVHVSNLEVVLTDEWDRALHERELDPDIVFVDDRRDDPAAELLDEDPEQIDGLNLDVNITVDRNAWARHPLGDVNFQAGLNADITGNLVAIHGSVDLLRGQLEFLGRQFEVRESEVTFTGAIPPNPRLRVEAHYMLDRVITQALGPPSTGDPRIEFHITGSAEQPRLELRSDPAMTDTEILFVLMTGRPPDRTDVGREEGVANQALAAVSGLFFGMLSDELAGTVPVDVLRLEPRTAGARGGRLEVGSYLTNDLFFAYQRQFGADEDVPGNIFRLEYHFLPRWMGEVVYTDNNEGELNFYWDVF